MKDTADRVRRISRELQALSVSLEWKTFLNSSPVEQDQILNALLNRGFIENLRVTIDRFSDFLWRYIEAAAENCDQEADYEMQNERLRRITEVLRLLHRSSYPSQDPLAFVDRMTESVDRHFEVSGGAELSLKQTA
jgi:hypothetical protein